MTDMCNETAKRHRAGSDTSTTSTAPEGADEVKTMTGQVVVGGPEEELLQELRRGNERYVADQPKQKMTRQQREDRLGSGQAPRVIILSCADSRVVPEMIFDADAGELFTLRVAGNVVNSDVLASTEYAVDNLKSTLLVVLGHTKCGAVGAAAATAAAMARAQENNGNDSTAPPLAGLAGHLPTLVSRILPAVQQLSQPDPVKANVQLQRQYAELGVGARVRVVGAVYDLESGRVEFY